MYIFILFTGLFLTYLALSENISPGNMVIGAMLAGIILLLLQPSRRHSPWKRLPLALIAMIGYVTVLFWDLIRSGIQVARLVLDPRLPIRQGIIRIPSESDSDLVIGMSAHWITLTPGELVVEIDENGDLYTHCLNIEQSLQGSAGAQQRRNRLIPKIFGEKR